MGAQGGMVRDRVPGEWNLMESVPTQVKRLEP